MMARGLIVVWEDAATGYAARLLRRLGFEVVAVGEAGELPWAETAPENRNDLREWYFGNVLHRTVDVGAIAEFRDWLLHEAVALIESWPDPDRARWAALGLSEEKLWQIRPEFVWASVTPYGRGQSPEKRRSTTLFAESGFMSVSGPVDGIPCAAPGAIAYDMAGAHLAMGVLAMLEQAERQDGGGLLDISMLECLSLCEHIISRASHEGKAIPRTGSQHEASAPGRIFPVRDGYVHFMIAPSSPGHWEKFRDWFQDPRLYDEPFLTPGDRRKHADALSAIVRERTVAMTRAEIFEQAKSLGLPMVPVHSLNEFVESPHERERLGFCRTPRRTEPDLPEWTHAVKAAGQTGLAPKAARGLGPLAGLTVLDFSHILSGPYATLLMAYLGATVIKVESPNNPDGYRRRHGQSNLEASRPFADFNRNKKSYPADLKTEDGLHRILELLPYADVLIENFRDGTLDRLGLSASVLEKAHPRLSVVRIRGLGTGPWSWLTAYGPTIQAICGLTAMWNPPDSDQEPVGTQGSFADYVGGIHAAIAALAAVRASRWDGQGRILEISMADSILSLLGPWTGRALSGTPIGPMGNIDPAAGRISVRSCADGHFVCLAEKDLARLDFHCEDLNAGEVIRRGRELGAEIGWVQDGLDLLSDPRLLHRNFLTPVNHPYLGAITFPGCPIAIAGYTIPQERAPFLGEDEKWVEDWLQKQQELLS